MNQVILLGNLGRDPEIKYTTGGKAVANLSVATTKSWKGTDGQWQKKTSWHRVTAWEKLAEACQILRKGSKVLVIGELDTRSWNDNSGKKNYITEVVAKELIPLSAQSTMPTLPEPDADIVLPSSNNEEDIPF